MSLFLPYSGLLYFFLYHPPSVERSAARLLRDAASLLVYQDVLQSPPAQAFLRLLLLLRRSDGEWKHARGRSDE